MMTTRTHVLVGSALAVLALPTLAGCGSRSAAATPQASASQGGGWQGGYGQGSRMPGVRGTIAEVDGSTVQVQSTQSQTAVTLGSTTRIRLTATTQRSALKAGECVQVTPPRSAATSGASSTSGAPATITAGNVVISSATKGSCQVGTRQGNSSGSSASPRPQASWSASGYAGRAFGTSGEVTAVTPSSFTVQQTRQGATTNVTVTTDASTSYQQQVSATRSAVKVGQCMTALGKADSSGTVAATQVVVSSPVNGSCTTGFGRGTR